MLGPDHALLQNSLTRYFATAAEKQPHPTILLLQNSSTPLLLLQNSSMAPHNQAKKLASTVTLLQNNWSPLQKKSRFDMLIVKLSRW